MEKVPSLEVEYSSYLTLLSNEVHQVVSQILLVLSSGGGIQSSQLYALFDKGYQELEQCLTRIRSLPATLSSLIVELSALYNLLYISALRERCLQHHKNFVLSLQTDTLLQTLKRVQYAMVGTERQKQDDPLKQEQQIPFLFSSLLISLQTARSRPTLTHSVGLLACMWSLIMLLERKTSPLPCRPLADWPLQVDKNLKHGFQLTVLCLLSDENETSTEAHSVDSLQNFACLLLAVSCFQERNWKECEKFAAKISCYQWRPLANVLTARALLESGHCLEAAAVFHTVLDNRTVQPSPAIVSCCYRLLSASYSAQNLPHLAVEMLRYCLEKEPGSTAALFFLAKQFGSMGQSGAEMECLSLLVKEIEKTYNKINSDLMQPFMLEDLLQDLALPGDRITMSQAVYHLAVCSAQQKRFKESAEAYMKLIQIYEDVQSNMTTQWWQSVEIQLPDLLTVCRKTAQALLESAQDNACLHLCNKVISAISSALPMSPTLFTSSDYCTPNIEAQQTTDSVILSQTDVPERKLTGGICQSGRKRQLSSIDIEVLATEEQQMLEWKQEENRTLLFICKAECLAEDGDLPAAVRVLNRTMDGLLEYWQRIAGQRSKTDEASTLSQKRPRCSVTEQMKGFSFEDKKLEESWQNLSFEDKKLEESWQNLSLKVCHCLSDILCRCGQYQQALHASRLAAQIQPDEKSLYYLCNNLKELGRGMAGCQLWLQCRGLAHNTNLVSLQSLLQQRQEMMSEAAEENCKRLGIVRDRQKLQLDLFCLQLSLETTVKQ